MVVFADRADAGRRLARELESVRGPDSVVLGLPRGGVPVAFEVAEALDAPLDVIVVRKLGVPFQPELAMGAIGEGGVEEERDRASVFDIRMLATRLTAATRWLAGRPGTDICRLGYFGASTGAGAALWAAAEPGAPVTAVVSRGGRPDLAGPRLGLVRAPTLVIVGSADTAVLQLNRQAQAQLRCTSELAVVAGATHLFEEPGTLAEAAILA